MDRILAVLFFFIPLLSFGQLDDCLGVNSASDHDNYFGIYDTLCAGECQRYWITNANCPTFKEIGFHWVFHGIKTDTLVGDTIYYCFFDTGVFLMDVYASNLNKDSSHTLNARNVVLPCPPIAAFTASQQSICTNQYVVFTDQSKRLSNQWQWTFEGGTPAAYTGKQPPPIYYADTGSFWVQLVVTGPYGSDNLVKTNYIHVWLGPILQNVPNEFYIKEGDEVTLYACASGNTYQWLPPVAVLQNQDTLLTVQPDETQNYTCTVATLNGCSFTCSYRVAVQSGLLLPTGFSPNGDGLNDVFRILNTNITLNRFEIFNRWGEKIFETNNIQAGWNGYYEGVAQPMDVYIWMADYTISKTGKQKTTKGNVTLVR